MRALTLIPFLLMACSPVPLVAKAAPAKPLQARAVPLPVGLEGRIPTRLTTPFLKDPSFVADGVPVGGARWIAFGDLRAFYVKRFDAKPEGGLAFDAEEQKIELAGLPAGIDAPWAPQIALIGDEAVLLYCAGAMPAPEPPRWETFRLRRATMPRAAFEAGLRAGRSPRFVDGGVLLDDLAPFGAERDFGVIDPHWYVNPAGRAYMTYTLVRPGVDGKRYHEEFSRFRRVDAADPGLALGPDTPLLDGRWNTEADGVAEAQDVATIGGRTIAFVSIRAGDLDQRIVAADVGPDLMSLDLAKTSPLLAPSGTGWQAKAVGSSSAANITGRTYMIHQGLSRDNRFGLGWITLAAP